MQKNNYVITFIDKLLDFMQKCSIIYIMRTITVENCKKKNNNVVNYILCIFPNLSKNIVFKALRNKDIKVNNKRISSNIVIQNGDNIDIYIDDIYLFNIPKKINYIYEDENIVIAFKPQGILSNNEREFETEPTFEGLVKKDFKTAKICHRLDRNTSGLLIFALNNIAYENMLNGFKNGCIAKEYIAYVSNYKFSKNHDVLVKYIIKDSYTGFCKIYDKNIKNSQKIITEYDVIYINKDLDYAILKVKIPTGKTHQIRAQLKDISHPIIGDSKYGNNVVNKKFNIYKQLLCAYKYTFNFKEDNYFHYLNSKIIEINKSLYIKNIGDINERNKYRK